MIIRKVVTQYIITDYVTSKHGADDIAREAGDRLTDMGCDGIGVIQNGDVVNVHGWVTEDVES